MDFFQQERLGRLFIWLEKKLNGKYGMIIIGVSALILSLIVAFPSFDGFNNNFSTGRSAEVAVQIDNLEYFWQNYNGRNTIFRITVPIIANFLGLDVKGTYGLQVIAGILLFYIIARIVERESGDRVFSLFFTLAIACTYAGHTSFVELRSMYDGIALFFLVLAIWSYSPFAIFVSILLASFTDERAIVASGFVFLWWALKHQNITNKKDFASLLNIKSLSVILGIIFHFIIRLIIANNYGVQNHWAANREFLFFDQINNIPMGLWTALEAGWVLITLAILSLIMKRKFLFLFLYLGILLIQSIGGLSVVDITRSLAYLLPALFVAMQIIFLEIKDKSRPLAMYMLIVNFLSVSYYAGGKSTIWWQYPLPLQLIRWTLLKK